MSTSEFKEYLHEVIFEADTPAGRNFDIILLIMIVLSVLVVMLETVKGISADKVHLFVTLEWIFTIFFTIEYLLRLYCTRKPMRYATSFFGVIDLLAIIPTYLSLFIVGTQSLVVIRSLRLLRVFRVFKMMSFLRQGKMIMVAMRASMIKIQIFLLFVLLVVCIFGSAMYLIEGGVNDRFDSIPRSVYWAIVTLTTVGYGDIAPVTTLGQLLSAIIMVLGYAVIAVPTGIISADLINMPPIHPTTSVCPGCTEEGHAIDAVFCKYCGEHL